MKFRTLVLAMLVGMASVVSSKAQEIIYESAIMGTGPNVGFSFANDLLGARFSLSGEAQVTAVGGRFQEGEGEFFAAIIALASPTAFPAGSPFLGAEEDVLVVERFNPPPLGTGGPAEVLVNLSTPLTLEPGDYALIFGTGFFQTGGQGGMPANNTEIGGPSFPPSFIKWAGGFGQGFWENFAAGVNTQSYRLFVRGFLRCGVNLTPRLTAGRTLNLNFDLRSRVSTDWNVWLSLGTLGGALPTPLTIPLWSAPLTPLELTIPVPLPNFPPLGRVGLLTTLTTDTDGVLCSDWQTVNTGLPPGPISARELRERFGRAVP